MRRPKRILFVTKCFAAGGAERHLVDLILRLGPDVDIAILCYGRDLYTDLLLKTPRRPLPILANACGETPSAYWKAFRQLRPDTVVFVNGELGLFPWYAYAAARLCGAFRVAAIEHLIPPPLPPDTSGRRFIQLARRFLGWRQRHLFVCRMQSYLSDWTICVSHGLRAHLIRVYGFVPQKTIAVWNGIDLTHYRPAPPTFALGLRTRVRQELDLDPADPLLLCVARLVPQKCIDVLLDAVALLFRDHPVLRCVVVGEGPLRRDLEHKRDQFGLAMIVRFVGHQSDVRPYLEAADMYVTVSNREGFGLSLTEAMAYALPCIATDIVGHDEIVQHQENGLLIPPNSPADLANAIARLLGDPDERTRLGRNAQARVRQCFDVDRAMARIRVILGDESSSATPRPAQPWSTPAQVVGEVND